MDNEDFDEDDPDGVKMMTIMLMTMIMMTMQVTIVMMTVVMMTMLVPSGDNWCFLFNEDHDQVSLGPWEGPQLLGSTKAVAGCVYVKELLHMSYKMASLSHRIEK